MILFLFGQPYCVCHIFGPAHDSLSQAECTSERRGVVIYVLHGSGSFLLPGH